MHIYDVEPKNPLKKNYATMEHEFEQGPPRPIGKY